MVNSIFITFKKELRSIFRDKKTIMALFLFPFFIPLIIIMYSYIYDSQSQDKVYKIGIDYEVHSTEVTMMDEANLKIVNYSNKKKMEDAYKKGDIYGYIDYNRDKNTYYVYVNEESQDGMYVSSYIKSYFDSYQRYLGNLDLVGEDIDVDKIYNHFSYEMVHLDGENFLLSLMFSLSFTYIVMAIVMATTNMAISASALEKENGTLETILTFPIKTRDLILGKYFAAVFMGVISSIMGLLLAILGLSFATGMYDVFENITFHVTVLNVFVSIIVVVIASFFIGGLSIALTSNAKSYKEAQSISSFLNILTIIPMFISMFHVSISSVYYVIPIFNYTQILMDIFSGSSYFSSLMIVILSSIIFVGFVIYDIIRRYHSEKVLF